MHKPTKRQPDSVWLMFLGLVGGVLTAVGHLAIGSSALMTIGFLLVYLIGIGFLFGGGVTFSTIFCAQLSIYSAGAALATKIFYGQQLQSNLSEPLYSCFIISASTLIFFFFMVLGGSVRDPKGTFGSRWIAELAGDIKFLKLVCVPLTIVGVVTQVLHVFLRPRLESGYATEGFGGFGSLYFILLFAVVIQFQLYAKTKSRIYGILLIISAGVFVFLSGMANIKKTLVDFVFIAILAYSAFQFRMPRVGVAFAGVASALVALFIFPALHIARGELEGTPIDERLTTLWRVIEDSGFSPTELQAQEEQFFQGYTYEFRPDASYLFPNGGGGERFNLILPVDQIVRTSSSTSGIELSAMLRSVAEGVLPSAIISKSGYVGADLIAWKHGIRSIDSIARPVIGYVASWYSLGGVVGALLLGPILLAFGITLYSRVIGPLAGSPVSVMFVASASQLVEKEVDSFLIFVLRDGMLQLGVIYIIFRIFRTTTGENET